jgi:hypothetical protein
MIQPSHAELHGAAAWHQVTESSSPSREQSAGKKRRLKVDPLAMAKLVDWVIDQDFGPDGGARLRQEAWH